MNWAVRTLQAIHPGRYLFLENNSARWVHDYARWFQWRSCSHYSCSRIRIEALHSLKRKSKHQKKIPKTEGGLERNWYSTGEAYCDGVKLSPYYLAVQIRRCHHDRKTHGDSLADVNQCCVANRSLGHRMCFGHKEALAHQAGRNLAGKK